MKRNFIKKLLVGGLITSICICCCFINVKASKIDDYAHFYSPRTYFNNYEYVEDINELKGTIWHLNFDFYELYNDYGEVTIELRFLQNIDTNSIFDLPFILQPRSDYIYDVTQYPVYSNYDVLNIAPLCNSNTGSAIRIEINENGARVYIRYYDYTLYEFIGANGNRVVTSEVTNVINDSRNYESIGFYTNDYSEYKYLDIAFSSEEQLLYNLTGSSELYLFFPNNNSYTFEESYSVDFPIVDEWDYSFTGLLTNYSTRIVFPYQYFNDINYYRNIGYDNGYEDGYVTGYQDGYDNAEVEYNDGYRLPFLTAIFNGISDLLALEIFPNVQLGYFIFVPLALGITGMIFWFWRKD